MINLFYSKARKGAFLSGDTYFSLGGPSFSFRGMSYFRTTTHSLDVKIFIKDKNIHQQNDRKKISYA